MTIDLFIAQRTGLMRMSLRRYTSTAQPCPNHPGIGHSAEVVIDTVPDDASMVDDQGHPLTGRGDDAWPHTDPRWPKQCACGYVFDDGDGWQLNRDELYDSEEYGHPEQFTLAEAPPGAMLRVDWFDSPDRPGESWLVFLPDGNQWITTQRARDGGAWTVTGTPPTITVTPSIWADPPHGWHGFIRDGTFVNA